MLLAGGGLVELARVLVKGRSTRCGPPWLAEPAERTALEARVGYCSEDALQQDRHSTVDTMMAAIRASGYELVIDVDAIEILGPSVAAADRG